MSSIAFVNTEYIVGTEYNISNHSVAIEVDFAN
ncbi:hypothetical protein F441_07134 [Phytophthora nicotianae CJ01A1]|uniref:Uncharacterized protein n=3 Tax=Phytophthora nicotianae TaxID=4792 RepID=W2QBP6_PHYN3|nr:hypothetical protein PPTG_22661 [Phytophthora nicotianae INRA-310]ETK88783.1 hypothetical protein L915_07008 [Phytophthora nicotianae]ETN10613.1 hypothetical protein PPTG_22661 [Phytophthora nicotianae INRA-310]ETP18667.1 hypothetical protein F441_07134 [Phytophthora nicotianae CJ01A1]